MLSGLMLNALVTDANAGTMPVVGMPSTLRPAGPMWQAATPKTQLPFLADQAQLGLFSIGDLVMIFGGILIVAICLRRVLKNVFFGSNLAMKVLSCSSADLSKKPSKTDGSFLMLSEAKFYRNDCMPNP